MADPRVLRRSRYRVEAPSKPKVGACQVWIVILIAALGVWAKWEFRRSHRERIESERRSAATPIPIPPVVDLDPVRQAINQLQNDQWLGGTSIEAVDAGPCALLMVGYDDLPPDRYRQIVAYRRETLRRFVQCFEGRIVEPWGLQPQMVGVDPDDVPPYIVINVADRDRLQGHIVALGDEPMPSWANAHSNYLTDRMYYADSDSTDESSYLWSLHRLAQVILDRYAVGAFGQQFMPRPSLFVHGIVEYAVGYQGDPSDPQFPGLNSWRVGDILIHQDECYTDVMPWGEDWCAWPLAYLWQPINIETVKRLGAYIMEEFYIPADFNAEWLRENVDAVWFNSSFIYSWAFTYYMLEVSEHAEAFSAYCSTEMNDPRNGGPEAFCRFMGWEDTAQALEARPLCILDVQRRTRLNWDLVIDQCIARAEIMEQSEEFLRLQADWFEWMKTGLHDAAEEQGIPLPWQEQPQTYPTETEGKIRAFARN